MGEKTVLVCGLGRCGSSLMMQMLSAAGLQCAGTGPDFEPESMQEHYFEGAPQIGDGWFASYDAVKIINPHQLNWFRGFPAVVVWLDRDVTEQAKSGLKILEAMVAGVRRQPGAVEKMAALLESQREQCIADLAGWPRIEVRFEDLVGAPAETASSIAAFLADFGIVVDVEAMVSVVIPRGPECQPDIRIEGLLLEAGGRSGYDS